MADDDEIKEPNWLDVPMNKLTEVHAKWSEAAGAKELADWKREHGEK